MRRLLTPLLRRVYLAFGIFVVVYLGIMAFGYSAWNKERLYRKLSAGNERQKASAAFDLAYLKGEEQLIRALRSRSPQVRTVAMNSLWDLWARAAGHAAFQQIQMANQAVERRAFNEALKILGRITAEHPTFPEGWNRRATLNWQMGRFQEAIGDAEKTVALNPNHFGAWQGLGLCHVHVGDMDAACRCIRRALRITPHDEALQDLLERCEKVLRSSAPKRSSRQDLI